MDSRPRSGRITQVRVIATREEDDTRKEFSLLPPRLASPRAQGFSREPAVASAQLSLRKMSVYSVV